MSKRPYICTSCGAEGVRLWREYQTFADHTQLLCIRCACADQEKDAVKRARKMSEGQGDQIGWLVPAVPCEPDTFWGYTSVPASGVVWWYALPLGDGLEAYNGRPPVPAAQTAFFAAMGDAPNPHRARIAFGDMLRVIIKENDCAEGIKNDTRTAVVGADFVQRSAMSPTDRERALDACKAMAERANKEPARFAVEWDEVWRQREFELLDLWQREAQP